MLNVDKKRKDKNIISRKITLNKKFNTISFRPTYQNLLYLNVMYDKTLTINRALSFWKRFCSHPEKLMVILKKQNPREWKYINRKRFLN